MSTPTLWYPLADHPGYEGTIDGRARSTKRWRGRGGEDTPFELSLHLRTFFFSSGARCYRVPPNVVARCAVLAAEAGVEGRA